MQQLKVRCDFLLLSFTDPFTFLEPQYISGDQRSRTTLSSAIDEFRGSKIVKGFENAFHLEI